MWSEVDRSGATTVLLGNFQAKVDEKFRVKLPAFFRSHIETTWGTGLYVTSDSHVGAYVQIYPMPVWLAILEKLAAMPRSLSAAKKLSQWTNYWGQAADLDSQGRVLIHPLLREAAAMDGEIVVLGEQDKLTLWNHARFKQSASESAMTDDDWDDLARRGL